MDSPTYADAALVLLGHGSTKNTNSGETVHRHAAALRDRRLFHEVGTGFLKQEPDMVKAASCIKTPRVFYVPMFASEGFFSEEIVPAKLGFKRQGETPFSRVRKEPGQTSFYCKPLGTHPAMTQVLIARARSVVEEFPFPRAPKPEDTTLFIAGHGTDLDANSRKTVEYHAASVRERNMYAAVHAVFLEEDPRVDQCFSLARTRNVVVVPFFMSEGLHVEADIPALLGESQATLERRRKAGVAPWRNPTERKQKRVWCAPAVGSAPEITDLILELVREAATWGNRPSEYPTKKVCP